jgi:hypothetical protein
LLIGPRSECARRIWFVAIIRSDDERLPTKHVFRVPLQPIDAPFQHGVVSATSRSMTMFFLRPAQTVIAVANTDDDIEAPRGACFAVPKGEAASRASTINLAVAWL